MLQTKIFFLIFIISFSIGAFVYLEYGLDIKNVNNLPHFSSTWYMGEGKEYEPILKYLINDHNNNVQLQTTFNFKQISDVNLLYLQMIDQNNNNTFYHILELTNDYTIKSYNNDEIKPHLQIINDTIFSKRDMDKNIKYLIHNSSWGHTFVGKLTPRLKVMNDIFDFYFGKLNIFKINYKIGMQYNGFFIVDNLPIPIRAQYYDINGNSLYDYELLSFNIQYFPLSNLYEFNNQLENVSTSQVNLHHK
ncbi:MAG: hypothetical protein OXF77_01385 [Thaumarchaeota archaeon]|nr:hypothetical protein [Nitrososphaerota archaeon]